MMLDATHNTQLAVIERRSDLDWLRVIAVLLLVPFHAALIFDSNPLSAFSVSVEGWLSELESGGYDIRR